MGPHNPAADPNTYGGQPLNLGNLQHDEQHPKPGPVPSHFLNAHTKAQTAMIVSVFPVFRYRQLPLVGQLLLLLPPAKRDQIRIRKMRPEVMANAVQPPDYANLLPWTDEPEQPVTRGQGYSALVITDSFQWILDITETKKHSMIPAPIPARQIAEATVAEWTSGLASGAGRAGIGVWNPHDGFDLNQFVAQLRAGQEIYFRELVMAADISFARTGQKEISDLMRMAAEWLGVDREWNKAIEEVIQKRCPACTTKIPQESLRCLRCQTDLPLWYQQYKFPAVEIFALDPHVGRFMQDRGMIVPVEIEAKGPAAAGKAAPSAAPGQDPPTKKG
jgi:hypothetical protein